jgi:hypothetical protein
MKKKPMVGRLEDWMAGWLDGWKVEGSQGFNATVIKSPFHASMLPVFQPSILPVY